MSNHTVVKTAVQSFLDSQIQKKTKKEQQQLQKAQENKDTKKIDELNQKITTVKEKHKASIWLKNATEKMAKELTFGTHISKGIHPDAKGDNIRFQSDNYLPNTLLGTHTLKSTYIDANGNAAALPLAAFFDFSIDEKTKISDLILNDNSDFIASLSKDKNTATSYHDIFKQSLKNTITAPVTHEKNKQLLWPIYNNKSDTPKYHNVVPLHPSSLTHYVYQRINHIKFSDKNKEARDNRFKKNVLHVPYVSLPDLATLNLGGTKPQNISLLTNKQGGRNYLISSMPPIIKPNSQFKLSKFTNTIFDNRLQNQCRYAINGLFEVIKHNKNNTSIRKQRKAAIYEILRISLTIAQNIRTNEPAGWSKDYKLKYHQKLWLDPQRAELTNEEDFQRDRQKDDWQLIIHSEFALWINQIIKLYFKSIKGDIGDNEITEWKREIEIVTKQYERAGKGVFL